MFDSCLNCDCIQSCSKQNNQLIPAMHPIYKSKKINTYDNNKKYKKIPTQKLSQIKTQDSQKAQIILNNSTLYEGQIKNDKPYDKNAVLIFPDGSYYRGQIQRGIIQGHGAYVFADQSYSYLGNWKQGLPHGSGLQVSPCGTYQGQFLKGKKSGYGKLKFTDGSIFIGNFYNNIINGQGIFQSAKSKSIAKGNWVNGFLQGTGKQQYPDGSEYIGFFKKGKPHGNGTFTMANKSVYVGQFMNGKPVGKGVLYKDNKQYPAEWNNDDIISISMSLNSMMNDLSFAGHSQHDKMSSIISRFGKSKNI